jgi:hypothetical protein
VSDDSGLPFLPPEEKTHQRRPKAVWLPCLHAVLARAAERFEQANTAKDFDLHSRALAMRMDEVGK